MNTLTYIFNHIYLIECFIILTTTFVRSNTVGYYFEKQLSFRPYKPLSTIHGMLDKLTYLSTTFPFCIGTPSQCFDVSIDTASPSSWLSNSELHSYFNHTFDESKSTSFNKLQGVNSMLLDGSILIGSYIKETPTPFNERNYKGNAPSKGFVLGLMSVTDLQHSILHQDGVIAIMRDVSDSNRYGNETTSYLDYLWDYNAINKKVFVVDYKSNTIVFGDNAKYSSMNNKQTCDSNDNAFKYSWTCKLNEVVYDNEKIFAAEDERVFFDTLSQFIQVPYESGEYLFNKIVSTNSEYCSIVQEDTGFNYIKCVNGFDVVKHIKRIDLVLSGSNARLTVEPHDMFYYDSDNNVYLSSLVLSKHNKNNWMVGMPAMKNKIMIFNKDDNSVSFIEGGNSSKKGGHHKNFGMFFNTMAVTLCVFVVLIVALYIRRKIILSRNKVQGIDFSLVSD